MLLSVVVKSIKRKSHRGDQSVTTDQITTDIIASINEAIRDLSKILPKRYWFKKAASGIAVTAGSVGTPAVYSLASDVQEPIVFHYTSGSEFVILTKVKSDREWIKKIWDPNAALQKPRLYREINPDSSGYKQLELFPVSDGSYTVNYEYYKTKGSDLTTSDLSTEIPNIPDHVQDAIEKGGLYYFLKGFDDPLQGIAKSDYEESKKALDLSDEQDKDDDISFTFGIMRTTGDYIPRFTQD